MTIDEILKKASPRPWQVDGGAIGGSDGELVTLFNVANRDLSILAVNAYEKQREVIRELLKLLGEIECGSCGHSLRYHLDRYGCEYEKGDDAYGRARGPCCCKAESSDADCVTALARAKELL